MPGRDRVPSQFIPLEAYLRQSNSDKERQQRKAIRYIGLQLLQKEYNPKEVFKEPDVSLGQGERQRVLEALRRLDPQRREGTFQTILQEILPAASASDAVDVVNQHETTRALIAWAVSKKENGGVSEITRSDIDTLKRTYETPLHFEKYAREYVREYLRQFPSVSHEQVTQWEQTIASSLLAIYGKKAQYWEQLKEIQREALAIPVDRLPLDAKTQQAIIRDTQIVGSTLPMDGKALTSKDLASFGLSPVEGIALDGVHIYLSKGFVYNGKHLGVIGYVVESGKRPVARTFYKSRSQDSWRYLPYYTPYEEALDRERFGKTKYEQSINLPVALQGVLDRLTDHPFDDVGLVPQAARLAFLGTAPATAPMKSQKPQELQKKFVDPKTIRVGSAWQEPDFAHPLKEWSVTRQSSLFDSGRKKVIYPSFDGSRYYSFLETPDGMMCQFIEDAAASIGNTGLKQSWVDGGDLITPLYEYQSTVGDVEPTRQKKYPYVSMAPYLEQIPLLQRFAAWRS